MENLSHLTSKTKELQGGGGPPPVLYQPKKPGMHRVNWAHSKLGSDSTTDDIMVKQLPSRILSKLTKPKKPLMPLTWSRSSEASNTKHVSISFSGLMR